METRAGAARITERKLLRPRYTVVYPQVSRLRSSIVEKVINQAILGLVYRLIRDQGYSEDSTKTGTGTYEIKWNGKGLLSLTLDHYAYAKGAAHGLTIRKSLTADLETGKIYRLEDFFLKGSNYRTQISDIVKQEFKNRDIPQIEPFEGIGPDQDYYLTDGALVIYFQLYEYTPYVWGFPEFPIPFGRLTSVIDPKGPLARLMKS